MKSKLLPIVECCTKLASNTVFHMTVLIGGSLGLIEFIHTRAHHSIEVDVHGYVQQYCKKNDCSKFDYD